MDALTVAPCSHAAAKYAVEHWHYTGVLPSADLTRFGVWEHGQYIGAVLFGRGANNRLGSPYGLKQGQVAELVRVALREHDAPVSRIVAPALKQLKRRSPGLRLIVSFADPEHGHHGGIYQAGNWTYTGKSHAQRELLIDGVFTHKRIAHGTYGTASVEKLRRITGKHVVPSPVYWKHTYVMPLDKAMRRRITPMSRPYPTRCKSQQ